MASHPPGSTPAPLAPVRVAAIGPGTADALARRGVRADLVPERFVAESLLEAFPDPGTPGERVLARAAEVGARRAPRGSATRGYAVDVLARVPHRHRRARCRRPRAVRAGDVRRGHLHVVVDRRRTSATLVGELPDPQPLVVSIGPVTSATARDRGLRVDVEADPHTIDGLVAALHHCLTLVALPGPVPTQTRDSIHPWHSPNAACAACAAPPRCAGWSRSTRSAIDDLVAPLFVKEGIDAPEPVASMPGVVQHTQESLRKEVRGLAELGIPGVILFGIPAAKDASRVAGRRSRRRRAGRAAQPPRRSRRRRSCSWPTTASTSTPTTATAASSPTTGDVDNDATLERYASIAVAQADAGADVIAPSGMMDGQVGAIRAALDETGHTDAAILAYAAKYASALYGPFRDAAECAPQFGDRSSYQMDAANGREALAEVALDIDEGADMVMVKPALAYLDVIADVRAAFDVPVAAYHVSGEYAMVKAAAQLGWIDGDAVALEHLLAIKRAGADIVLTYFARERRRVARVPRATHERLVRSARRRASPAA